LFVIPLRANSAQIHGFGLVLLERMVIVNLLLAAFNLIPIPPLDGYNVLLAFLPPRQAMVVRQYAPYGVIILLLLVFLPGSPLRELLGLAVPVSRALIGA
jgi:Zn-dependent protease